MEIPTLPNVENWNRPSFNVVVANRDVNSREIAFPGRVSQFLGLDRDSRFRLSTYFYLHDRSWIAGGGAKGWSLAGPNAVPGRWLAEIPFPGLRKKIETQDCQVSLTSLVANILEAHIPGRDRIIWTTIAVSNLGSNNSVISVIFYFCCLQNENDIPIKDYTVWFGQWMQIL